MIRSSELNGERNEASLFSSFRKKKKEKKERRKKVSIHPSIYLEKYDIGEIRPGRIRSQLNIRSIDRSIDKRGRGPKTRDTARH